MAAWVVITAGHLQDYLVGAQMSALRRAALGSGQTDPFERVMQDRCNYVRTRISSKAMISATPYAVPPELKTCAAMLIIESMQGRIPALKLSEDQKNMITRAYKDLDIAGTKDLPVSDPDDPATAAVQTGGGIEVASVGTRRATRSTLDGL
ncbi:MAG: hypothetical protein V2A34_02475 [Lentisphaerota bacterium]